jgi:regulatory protein
VDNELTLKQIKKDCLRLLTRREHSRKEIEQKLAVKGYQQKQVVEVLAELTKQSWQDDKRFAESFINMRRNKGFGPVKIAYELQQQGIDKDTVEQLIHAISDDWQESLEQVYRKKFANLAVKDNIERSKRIRFLSQRGFPNGMIIDVIEQSSKPTS